MSLGCAVTSLRQTLGGARLGETEGDPAACVALSLQHINSAGGARVRLCRRRRRVASLFSVLGRNVLGQLGWPRPSGQTDLVPECLATGEGRLLLLKDGGHRPLGASPPPAS